MCTKELKQHCLIICYACIYPECKRKLLVIKLLIETWFSSGLRFSAILNTEHYGMSSSGLLFSVKDFFHAWIRKKNKKPFWMIILFATDYTNACFLKQRILSLYIMISSLCWRHHALKNLMGCERQFPFTQSRGFICLFLV